VQNLYVLYDGGAVVEFSHNGKQVLRTVTDGIHSPDTLAVDPQGTLYVGNYYRAKNGAIKVYPPGASSPSATIEVSGRQVLAVDAADDLYVGTDRTNTINVYANQGQTLVRTLTGTSRPYALAVDPGGNVYAGNATGVNVYASGGTKIIRSLPSQLVTGLALDGNSDLYVLSGESAEDQTVTEYEANSSQVERTIARLYYANAIAVDEHSSLYVSICECNEGGGGQINVYPAKATVPQRTIERGIDNPVSIAYDNPDLYVGNGENFAVTMYRHGKPRLLRSIIPPHDYGTPVKIAFGP
jgi:sugar lactone lactonase YvrE